MSIKEGVQRMKAFDAGFKCFGTKSSQRDTLTQESYSVGILAAVVALSNL